MTGTHIAWLRWLLRLCLAGRGIWPIQRVPGNGQAGAALPAGDYLAWTWGAGMEGMALADQAQPIRRLSWLRQPGLNILWMRLDHDWAAPCLQRLGGKDGIRGKSALRLRRVPRGLGEFLERRRPFAAFDRALWQIGLGQWRMFWPQPRIDPQDPWYDWAWFLPELTNLKLEDITPDPAPAQAVAALAPATAISPRVGAHAHLHYLAVWPEIARALGHLPTDARILITLSDAAVAPPGISLEQALEKIARDLPHARVSRVPNRGRDLAPFMDLLAQGAFDGLDCVCKVHGKMSFRDGRPTWMGTAWREQAFYELLPSTSGVSGIARRFRHDPSLGVLGPERLRLPSERHPVRYCVEDDGGLLSGLMVERFGRDFSSEIDFFAGSMFWFRPEALASLRTPPAAGWNFPGEPIPDRATLAHALERLLPTAARLSGYRVESLPPRDPFSANATI